MARFGRTDLPDEQEDALRRAKRIEWLNLGYTAFTVTIVAFVVGNSQAMRTAWIEDMLSTLPQIVFLIAVRFIRQPASARYPYGMHRAMNIGHLVAGVALLIVGGTLAFEAISGLLAFEHPTIGTVALFGETIWLGWLMVGVMAVIAIAPFFFAHAKKKLATKLNNKLLYADAAMAKADWSTNLASVIGVLGIGLGLWWLDGAAATFIAAGILWDGLTNTKAAVLDLIDEHATSHDEGKAEPLVVQAEQTLLALPWVREAACRARDQGQVVHVEAFVVPNLDTVTVDQVDDAAIRLTALHWTMQDVVVTPVSRLPDELRREPSRSD